MDILTIMDIAAEIEDRLALLYHSLSRHYHENPDGCSFWERLSLEEKRHADRVRTYRRQRLDLPVYRLPHPQLISELEAIKRLILKTLKSLDEPTIAESLAIAYDIEGKMIHAHLGRICEVKDPLLAKLLIKLGHEDRYHQEKIRHFGWKLPSRI